MKVRKIKNSILTFGMVLILFIALPVFERTAYAGTAKLAKLNVTSQEIVKGKTFTLRVYNLKPGQVPVYISKRPSVADVDDNGVVTALEKGNATIQVRIMEGTRTVKTLHCNITVGVPASGVMISKLDLTLEVGDQARLTYIVFPLEAVENPVFSTSDATIASVTPGGRVIGENEGQAQVYCSISNGAYATCDVTVIPKPVVVAEPEPQPVPTETQTVETPAETVVEQTTVETTNQDTAVTAAESADQ